MTVPAGPRPEWWGGIECTVNRVGDAYFDQLDRCGHDRRPDDLDAIAALGIRALRYPALWERVAPDGLARADWRRTDDALARIRDLGIEPIVGFVHHGSGPRSTNLLDARFATGLAEYARAFAQRYPWVRKYTPINEPLTTARFSALYGHWYPHRRDDRSFVTALLTQCRAVAEAMAAIRLVAPDAELVQTEDAGSTRGTTPLADQVQFENARRWLSFDLLTGRVSPDHFLWTYLSRFAARPEDLEWLREAAAAAGPMILGLNYYVTSDRFVDHRIDRYPEETWGGNGQLRYADIEAVRAPRVGLRGHAAALKDAWERYQLPVAISEAHLGCTREEQMRWLADAWQGALDASACGVDVRAVTAWALLGSWDWDSLVTRRTDHYEAGAFDVRGGSRRPTAIAGMLRELAAGRAFNHPVLEARGWWRGGSRPQSESRRPVMILGANGTLGRAFAQACAARAIDTVALSRADVDITRPEVVRESVAHWGPWAIVNAAGYVRVDDAENDRLICRRTNALGPAILAATCRVRGIRLLTFSSDLVFDGEAARPYVESDPLGPLNIYGRTKAECERRVLALDPASLVVRTSAFFGPSDAHNFVTQTLQSLAAGRPVRAAEDTTVSPTYVPDLVETSLDLLIDGASGLWHLANAGQVTWAAFARSAAAAAGFDPGAIEPCRWRELGFLAARPSYSVLGTERGVRLPDLDDALARYIHERRVLGTAA